MCLHSFNINGPFDFLVLHDIVNTELSIGIQQIKLPKGINSSHI